MNDILYLDYPEITTINANIINKRYNNGKTQLIFDRTIFSPNNDYLLNDLGTIDNKKLIDVFKKNEKIVHLVDGKIESQEVTLSLDKSNRYRNLYYNTGFCILKLIMQSLYNIKNTKLKLYSNYGQMIISDFFVDFNKEQLQDFVDKLITLGIKIDNTKDFTEITSIGKTKYTGVCFDNTSKIFGLYIFRYNIIGNGLILEFVTGEDYLDLNKKNIELLKKIQKIATSENFSNDKITKIISTIQSNRFL